MAIQSSCNLIKEILCLAQRVHCSAHQYFCGRAPSQELVSLQLQAFLEQNSIAEGSQCLIDTVFLKQLEFHMRETSYHMLRTFSTELQRDGEYRFLRDLWMGHCDRSKKRDTVDERIDGLNQTISMVKLRIRNLSDKGFKSFLHDQSLSPQQEQHQFQIQSQEFPIQHPLYTRARENFQRSNMQVEELSQRLSDALLNEHHLRRLSQEQEQQISALKQRNKIAQKTVFDLTKAKVNLEQKIFDISTQNKPNKAVLSSRAEQGNKENEQPENDKTCERGPESLTGQPYPLKDKGNLQLAQSYKNMSRYNKRVRLTQNLLDASIDSMKTVRFERCTKKSLIGVKNLQSSVCLSKEPSH